MATTGGRKRATSDPNEKEAVNIIQQRKGKSAFPKLYDHSGYLDIRTRATKAWKRKYFVLANNFLLMASTPYSEKLEKVIPLEGSNVKTTTKTSHLSFEILIRKKRNQFRAPNEVECNRWTEKIQRASRLKIKDVYRFDAILGSNTTGSTKVASAKHRVTGEEVAVKVISKKEYNPKMLSNEVLILKRLDHPHVVKLFDLFETKKSVYLVMEKCLGGELFEQIANLKGGGGFTEKECVHILHQIAKAVKYMHSMGIVHRDLKPENILCVYPNSIQAIKIADFGISKVIFDPDIRRKEKEELRKAQKQKQKQLRTLQQRAEELYKEQHYHNHDQEEMKINTKHLNILSQMEEAHTFAASPSASPRTPTDSKKRHSHKHHSSSSKKKSKKSRKIIDPLAKKKPPNGGGGSHRQHRLSNAFREQRQKELMNTMCGTISYTAPEILKEKPYDKRVDFWSVGVIAFILLCGYPPFWGDTEVDVAHNILSQRVRLDPDDWSHVSDNGKRLVLGLLEKNPNKRLSVDDILKHTWLYASKSINHRARKSFMQTVAKRRIRKMSMGVFEVNSKRMDYLYRNHKKHVQQQQQLALQAQPSDTYNSNDEELSQISQLSLASNASLNSMSSPLGLERAPSNSSATSQASYTQPSYTQPPEMSYSRDLRNSVSYSRTDDDLFELRLPMSYTPRTSTIDQVEFGMDEDDDATFQFDLTGQPMMARRQSSNFPRKYSQ
eukprot:CAMPEP_0197023322 /NCGR_PEP_ID=MMETSP1384-20130603/4039_1 /TAXON_ID=29189 /ORGANISM="Ammonia sp." /LENGTH=722 /DNA_ID=CAMNT_0042451517 /DNA_START=22 /DNA_END=2190 /DNA_ORIENTATION=+